MSSKKPRVQLYADENIPVTCITHLKEKGISAVHAYDYKFIQKPDKEHLKKSRVLKRVLVSLDKDVNKFINADLSGHPGVILLSTGDSTPSHLNLLFDKVVKHITPDFAKEARITVTIAKLTKEKDGKIAVKKI